MLSISSLATTPEYLSALDEEGYMPISFLVSQPPLCDSDVDIRSLIEFLASCPEYALSSDSSLVRLAIPMNRHTIILRDVPEEARPRKTSFISSIIPQSTYERKWIASGSWTIRPSPRLLKPSTVFRTPRCWDPLSARVKGARYMKELYKQS